MIPGAGEATCSNAGRLRITDRRGQSMKSPKQPQPSIEDRLTSPVDAWLYRLVGAVLAAIGVALAIVLVILAWDMAAGTAEQPLEAAPMLVLGGIAAFCSEVGARLVLGRRSKAGSLMGVRSWQTLGIVFLAVTAWLGWAIVANGRHHELDGVLIGAILAVACFGMARHLRNRQPQAALE